MIARYLLVIWGRLEAQVLYLPACIGGAMQRWLHEGYTFLSTHHQHHGLQAAQLCALHVHAIYSLTLEIVARTMYKEIFLINVKPLNTKMQLSLLNEMFVLVQLSLCRFFLFLSFLSLPVIFISI
jgi:hypothetical protein